jgi:hypothetical protein
MKLLYKPFAIVAGVIGAKVGQSIFKSLWAKLDDSDPPAPTAPNGAPLPKIVGAAALEAATLAGTKAVVDHARARSFHYLTGIWPGAKKVKSEAAAEDEAARS